MWRRADIGRLLYTSIKEKCCDDDRLHLGCNIDLAKNPPCRGALQQHISRVNYQVAVWRQVDIPVVDIPAPTHGHGWTLESRHLEPLWVDGSIIPKVLADEVEILDTSDSDSDNEDSDGQESPHASESEVREDDDG